MTKEDIDKAIKAYRFSCPYVSSCKHLDGTITPDSCFALDCRERNYKCKGEICPNLRKFINILKDPE